MVGIPREEPIAHHVSLETEGKRPLPIIYHLGLKETMKTKLQGAVGSRLRG